MAENTTDIIIYQTEDGNTKIEVSVLDESVWLTQAHMAELFQTTPQNITMHIRNVYKEGELEQSSTCKDFLQVQQEGGRSVQRAVKYYNLDVIISVGYRVRSLRGTQFRIWATKVLREYLVKGFSMNDDLLKQAGGGQYWQELLERIRDIRSSEKVFYRQILEIYATSVDYDPKADQSTKFFRTVQNKMHYAAHGNTAAELIYARADGTKDFMGLTTFKGARPSREEAIVAKNYLSEDEVKTLNLITSMFLDFAELQAQRKNLMHMKDWVEKLDGFIQLSGNELLHHAGSISSEAAKSKAQAEHDKYKLRSKDQLSEVEKHYIASIKQVRKKIEGKKKVNNDS